MQLLNMVFPEPTGPVIRNPLNLLTPKFKKSSFFSMGMKILF